MHLDITHYWMVSQLTSYFYSTRVLRKNCPYSELLWSVFSRIQTEYGELWSVRPYSIQMRENTDQNNSEYGHLSRSEGNK